MISFVATPIGNLKDITLRALETLKGADVIFCEDTRHTVKLLNAYEIKKPLFACHKFNETSAAEKILQLSREGKDIAVVSDAGTPVVSDPGNIVCKTLREAGEPYTLIPGACAFVAALVLSSLPADRFAFVGFLPDKTSEKKALLEKYKDLDMTLAFHSAPQDVEKDVKAMYEVFGERRASAVREITKIHEESVPFLLSEGLAGEKRGEYVLIVEGAGEKVNPWNALSEKEHIRRYMDEGLDKKEALKRAAKDRGVSKSELYPFALDL
ncbi:MAG: 16S rRNA (cytidine(1402)-2'-O)-methyltransferase [Firmicutes bacterium]|nr:16S rRNA (cytidine(1402)-2'-O)-methyltransferase [Clostridia bacterium]MBS5023033.1 16S rRNA (cytidine(1402)-2'-O)-methyltransferase [Bacillota bacterium]